MDKTLEKLTKLLEVADEDTMSQADFIEQFEVVINIVKQIKTLSEEDREDIHQKCKDFLLEVKEMNGSEWLKIKERVSKLKDGQNGRDGRDGKDGIDGKDGERGIDGSQDTPIQIATKLNTLEEEVDMEVIKGLVKKLEELEEKLSAKRQEGTFISGGGNNGGGHVVKAHDLSPQLNGVLKTFNLPAMWRVISVTSSSFPTAFREGIDYTWTPQSITFTDEVSASGTLATGQTLIIIYSE